MHYPGTGRTVRSVFCRFVGGLIVAVALTLIVSCRSQDTTVNVAVAANFTETAQEIAELFKRETGDAVVLSFGSTGQLFTQISQEAPFDIFLAADQETPRKVADEGFGAADSLFTYAVGRIVLFSRSYDLAQAEAVLREARFERIAIANPTTAPYGAAAVEAMKALGVYDQLSARLVQGNSIAQAFQFVDTGNAELGFVALSQVVGKDDGSTWVVPENLYSPIRQDAILLKRGMENDDARTFIEFLKSPKAIEVIKKYGYGTVR